MDSLSDLYVIFECKLVLMVEADEINGRLITGLTVTISEKGLCHLSTMLGIICLITSILANFANLVNLCISVLI